MGEEPYYIDRISQEIIDVAIPTQDRDFNQMILYGNDVKSIDIVEAARKFPMFSSRQLIVVKEAQHLDKLDSFVTYLNSPMPTTVLVLSFTNKSVDKRSQLYKKALEKGVVFESLPLTVDMIYPWIESYLKSRHMQIDPNAAMLLAEYCGTELRKLAHELEKLITWHTGKSNLIDLKSIELNVGISREFSVFELTHALSFRDLKKALSIARHLGRSPKQYPLILTYSAIFMHFSRVLKLHGYNMSQVKPTPKPFAFLGVNPYFMSEYLEASKRYSLIDCIRAVSIIRDFDRRSKISAGVDGWELEHLTELIIRIVN
jgi:DNA polymerase-3 subunit delta